MWLSSLNDKPVIIKYYSGILLLLFPMVLFCQEKISGKVMSPNHQPMQGASVFIPNTKVGVQTNSLGEFVLTKVPPGNIKIAVSYIGYETAILIISSTDRNNPYIIILQPKNNELEAVTIAKFDKNGWKKWGDVFTAAFIGTSEYAGQCDIKNKTAFNFIYAEATKQLYAYASEPIIIENRALGYRITVTLTDFVYNVETREVDYQVYSLFEEMPETNDEAQKWNANRKKVYSLSLMHFMRALYSNNLKNEGFEIHLLERKKNAEKMRVQELYNQQYSKLKDSINDARLNKTVTNKLLEKSFAKDSLKYYKKILVQDDRTENLHPGLLSFKNIATHTDSNSVVLHFDDYIQVTYNKTKEPEEYFAYKNENAGINTLLNAIGSANVSLSFPVSELNLQLGIPIEINENGYFNNIDLYMTGFWGWWEKLGTKLPYEYEP